MWKFLKNKYRCKITTALKFYVNWWLCTIIQLVKEKICQPELVKGGFNKI